MIEWPRPERSHSRRGAGLARRRAIERADIDGGCVRLGDADRCGGDLKGSAFFLCCTKTYKLVELYKIVQGE